jgi:energy-coupling factor transporter ATP-binding protein EcfA2
VAIENRTDSPALGTRLAVSAIRVRELFGRFDYDIEVPAGWSNDDRRLLLLYGDNGAGKTTILQLLYHAISTSPSQGHKTFLVGVPFRSFAVEFESGVTVEALRTDGLTGAYSYRITQHGSTLMDYAFTVRDDRIRIQDNPDLGELVEAASLVLPENVFYLTDDRQLLTDSIPPLSPRRQHQLALERERRLIRGERLSEPPEFDALDDLLDRSTHWIRRQSLDASTRGNVGTNALYSDVLRRIATPSTSDDPSIGSLAEATEQFERLSERNNDYARLGLVPSLEEQVILESLRTVSGSPREDAFLRVLLPFMEGLVTRLDALSGLFDSMSTFVRSINSFLSGKYVELSPSEGVKIYDTIRGEQLHPSQLSSGERQLLLLFLNVLFTHDNASLFIVDEPELSLNVKWQRRLIDEIFATTAQSPTQFVMATHSIEILSGARDRVAELKPVDRPHKDIVTGRQAATTDIA